DGTNAVIKLHRYDGNGNSATPGEELVDTTTPGPQSNSAVAKADDGRFVVSYRAGSNPARLTFQQFQADGTPVAGKRTLPNHGGSQSQGGIGASGNGTFAFAEEEFDTNSNRYTPYAQTYQVMAPAFFAVGGGTGRLEVHRISDGGLAANFRPYSS